MALVSFKKLTAAQFDSTTKNAATFYRVVAADSSESLYIGSQKLNNTQDILDALYANRIEYQAEEGATPAVSVEDALDDLYSQIGEGGSVAQQIADAISALDTGSTDVGIASVTDGVVTIKGSVAETDGIITAGSASDVVLAKVATSAAAEDISVTDEDGHFTGSDLETVLEEVAEAIESSTDAGKVTVETPSSATYAAVYEFYQGVLAGDDAAAKAAKKIGTINIPKDMVVSAAELKTVTTADDPYAGAVVGDKYIDLTIANASSDHIYLPVNDLVDVYTGSTGSEITVAVNSSTNAISATVNKVAASKIITREADAGEGISEQNLPQKLTEIEGEITSAIAALDATESQTAGADGLALSVTEVDGVITSISGSIAANTYDAYGAASDVLGASTDATTAMTVNGVKNYVVNALTWEEVSSS